MTRATEEEQVLLCEMDLWGLLYDGPTDRLPEKKKAGCERCSRVEPSKQFLSGKRRRRSPVKKKVRFSRSFFHSERWVRKVLPPCVYV